MDISTRQELASEAVFGTVEAVKTVSDLFMPITGSIIAVNPDLADDPASVNKDPYGKGWMIRVKLKDKAELDGLMTAEAYGSLVG